jgi:hypothetical protein
MPNHPGHSCPTDEFFVYVNRPKYLTLQQIDLMTEGGRRRFFDKTLKKYTVKSLLLALMEKGITLTDEQMEGLKNGQ